MAEDDTGRNYIEYLLKPSAARPPGVGVHFPLGKFADVCEVHAKVKTYTAVTLHPLAATALRLGTDGLIVLSAEVAGYSKGVTSGFASFSFTFFRYSQTHMYTRQLCLQRSTYWLTTHEAISSWKHFTCLLNYACKICIIHHGLLRVSVEGRVPLSGALATEI
ncbi:hypothetical protein ZHAS_00005189 [Anopheles sinensis]|uniref:Uncharacterized protein n=1 Tax=Anopheles sinensis TaxID=74873 RepID=A0A084VIS8_ANOSI|nr:hypothetical protein ZHAS_00005189 [Anopheles sinensis]